MLSHIQRLHVMGFALHWLKPRSKQPVESGWTTGPRKSWPELKKSYRQGYNVGVRTGTPSKIGAGFLACIDVDIKDPKFAKLALAKLSELTGGIELPEVRSGSGHGSRHLYCLTAKPFKMLTVAKVPDKWEICVYSDGRQMVLPPSIHPNRNPYAWVKDFDEIPFLNFEGVKNGETEVVTRSVGTFAPEPCDLKRAGVPLSVVALIREGVGCEDRSAALFGVVVALVRAGLNDNQILTALTEPDTFLGRTAYDHAKTRDRGRAAEWLRRFTLDKVRRETNASTDFAQPAQDRFLSDGDARAQFAELVGEPHWKEKVERTDKEGRAKVTLKNVYRILVGECGHGVFVRDEFAGVELYGVDTPWGGKKGQEITDRDTVAIKVFFADQWRIEPANDKINEAIMQIANENKFHPVRDYLDRLEWDGVARLDTWLKSYHRANGPEPYLSSVSRKVLCAMVARVYSPGIKFDQVLILEGLQGVGKSTAIRTLAGDAWFTDAYLDLRNKDAALNLKSKWVFELGELGAMTHADTETLKAFISTQADYIRAPYGRRAETHPRQCIFIGSTNKEEYLKDLTGNRRFWPVKVGQCDFAALKRDRDQLLAEAKFAWELGEELYLEDKVTQEQAQAVQESKVFEDALVEQLGDFLNKENAQFPTKEFTIGDLYSPFGPCAERAHHKGDQMRVADALRVLGYQKVRKRKDGGLQKVYWTKEKET